MNATVNRYLEDKMFDRIDHALGRPVDPMKETFRNHYATSADGQLAKEFDASPFWTRTCIAPGRMAFYVVTDEGRKALAAHLKEIGDENRLYRVSYQGWETGVAATSAGKAKYSVYLNLTDTDCDLTFAAFCRDARVRLDRKEAAR